MTWYRDSFGLEYLEIYSHRNTAEGEFEAERIMKMLALEPGDRVLDVACGNGRHTFALERLGARMIGVDLSGDLLRDALDRTSRPNETFVRGDMRRLPLRPGFDAALSLFTSFGYFDDEADDRRVLRSIAGVLRPGGRYLLDFLNEARVRATLVPRSEETLGGRRVVQERSITTDGHRIEKTIQVFDGESLEPDRVFRESVRLYGRADLESMFSDAGIAVTDVLGSFRGDPYGMETPRLIVVGRKGRG